MVSTNKTAFLGLRIPEEAKAKLEAQAAAQALSLTEYCKKLLAAGVNRENPTDGAAAQLEAGHVVDDQNILVQDIKRLEEMRTELQGMCDERSGLFNSAPESLRTALRSVKSRLQGLTKKLQSMMPAEKQDGFFDFLL